MEFKVEDLMNLKQVLILKRGLQKNGAAQRFFIEEIKKMSDPYIPFQSGNLKTTQVRIFPNCIVYYAPYARRQYYENRGNGKDGLNKGGFRGKQWDKRMWIDRGDDIVKSVANYIGGKAR